MKIDVTPKIASAARSIVRINPGVTVEPHAMRLTAESAPDLVRAYDIVADGSDNFDTRYAVADACAEFVEAESVVLDYLRSGRLDPSGYAAARKECQDRIKALADKVKGSGKK